MGRIADFFLNAFSPIQDIDYTSYSTWGNDSTFSDGSKYRDGLSNSGDPNIYNISTTRINAKNAYHESPVGRSIVDRKVDTVVDSGLVFRSKPMYDILKIDKKKAKDIGNDLTNRFRLYLSSKTCTSSGNMDGFEAQRHAFLTHEKDGEVFALFNRGDIHGRRQLSPLTLQFIPNCQVGDGLGYVYTDGRNDEFTDFNDGIERDEYCREINYSVSQKVKVNNKIEYKRVKVPAFIKGKYRMIHYFIQSETNQLRGFALLKHVAQELQHLLDLDLSHIVKAITQSQFALAVESDGDENSVDISAGLGYQKTDIAADAESLTDEDAISEAEALSLRRLPEASVNIPGSVIVYNLPKGQKVNNLSNTAPSVGYAEFVESFISYICSSCGIPIEVLRMKFGQNYSASRATLVLAWRIANICRQYLISSILIPWYESWVEEEIELGRINLPGFSDPVLRAAWLNGEWIGTPMPEIDPLKTANANKVLMETNVTTLNRVCSEVNGSDGDENITENEDQFSRMKLPPWLQKNNISNDNSLNLQEKRK